MQTMHITLPDQMKQFVEEQVAAGSYSSISEYVRDLVRAEQKRQAKAQLEQTLLEALSDGEAIELTEDMLTDARQRIGRHETLPEMGGR